MTMRHRKLFPALADNCQGFCEEACADNCYNYSDYNFQLSPPLPPPNLSSRTPNIALYVILVLIILAILFLASFFLLAVKSQPGWFRSRSNWQEPQSQTDNRDEEFLDEIRTVVHPIGFIARTGLHPSTINSIAVLKYRKVEGLIEGTECSVCLNEFQEDETLRLLPKCNHAFHISCINTWLRSHANCPLCRAHIVDDVVDGPLISVNRNPDHLNAIVGPQMEDHETVVELGDAQQRNQA